MDVSNGGIKIVGITKSKLIRYNGTWSIPRKTPLLTLNTLEYDEGEETRV